MNELQIFKNNEFGEIRGKQFGNDGWLLGKDIAEKLGYRNGSRDINRHVDEEDRRVEKVFDGTQNRNMILINESGLYSLVIGSDMPNARKFRRWVTKEVLPSIRKYGGYISNQENLTNEQILANAMLVAQNVIKEKDKLLEEQKPKVLFAEAVESSDDVILVKEMANILSQRGFKIGQNQLFQFLRDKEYLCKRKGDMYHLPTKRYQHFFKVTKRVVQNSKGSSVKNTPKITGKGQMYFIKKFDEFLEQGLTVRDLLKEDKQ